MMIDLSEHGGIFSQGGGDFEGDAVVALFDDDLKFGDSVITDYPLTTVNNNAWFADFNFVVFSSNGEFMVTHGSNSPLELYKVTEVGYDTLGKPDIEPTIDTNSKFTMTVCDNGIAYGHNWNNVYRNNIKVPVDVTPAGNFGGMSFDETGDWLYIAHDLSPFLSIYKWDETEYKKVANLDVPLTSSAFDVYYQNGYIYVGDSSTQKLVVYKKTRDNLIKQAHAVDPLYTSNPRRILGNKDYLMVSQAINYTSSSTELVSYKLADGLPIGVVDYGEVRGSMFDFSRDNLFAHKDSSSSNYVVLVDADFRHNSGTARDIDSRLASGTTQWVAIDKIKNELIALGSNKRTVDLELRASKRGIYSPIPSQYSGIGVAMQNGKEGEAKKIKLFVRRY